MSQNNNTNNDNNVINNTNNVENNENKAPESNVNNTPENNEHMEMNTPENNDAPDDYFSELYSCSEKVLNKVLKYEIDRDQFGRARVYIPEDDDHYLLSAYIEYLENEMSTECVTTERAESSTKTEDSPISSIDSEDTSEDEMKMEMDNTNQNNNAPETQPENHQVQPQRTVMTLINVVPYRDGAFSSRIKYKERSIAIDNAEVSELLKKDNQSYLIIFQLGGWKNMADYGDIDFYTDPDNRDYFDVFEKDFSRQRRDYHMLQLDFGVTIRDLWAMIHERLNIIMTSKSRERMNLFLQMYQHYLTFDEHLGNGRKTLNECYRTFYRSNRVTVDVRINVKHDGVWNHCVGHRIYTEAACLSPIAENSTLEEVKRFYNPAVWKTVVYMKPKN